MKINKKFLATAFTLAGTIIGAGILGLPYVFSKSGLIPGILILITAGLIMMYVNLAMAETTLRTPGVHQLSGYTEKYLGKKYKKAMFLSVAFGIYSALLAYLIGEGESFVKLFHLSIHPVFLGIAFWLVTTLMLREGLKGLKKVETWGVIGIIVIVIAIFLKYLPQVQTPNLLTVNYSNLFIPIGVAFFAMLGFTSVPELRREIKGQERKFKSAIILGSCVPIALYILFSFTFIGVLGNSISEVATLSFGPIITILGIFTMFTSFFVLSFALKDMLKYDFKVSNKTNFALASLLPLSAYILLEVFSLNSFVEILGIGGILSAGFSGILILLTAKKAKEKTHDKKPQINIPISWATIIILSIVFAAAIIIEFLH